MSKNNEKSIISTLFTDKELKELNFTPEEIEAIENAEAINQMVELMPSTEKDIDAFFAKFDAVMHNGNSMEEIYMNFLNLAKTDPKFFNQILAMNMLIDEVEEVPEAKQEKVSLDDINKEKLSQEMAARKAQFDAIDKMLNNK